MIEIRFYKWIYYWLSTICYLIGILTLTFYKPSFDVDFIFWHVTKAVEKKKKEKMINDR
jgi:hypothetical protein